jgi:hypothetical protein
VRRACTLVIAAACSAPPARTPIVDPRTVCAAFRTGDLRGAEAATYSQLARTGVVDAMDVMDAAHEWWVAQRCIARVRPAPCGADFDRVVLEVHFREHRHQGVTATRSDRGVRLEWGDGTCTRRSRRPTWEERELAELRAFWRYFR